MLFAFRLSFSGKPVHKVFVSGGSEAFLECDVHAFATLGGVPDAGPPLRALREAASGPALVAGEPVDVRAIMGQACGFRAIVPGQRRTAPVDLRR